jgi:hypothetical protein
MLKKSCQRKKTVIWFVWSVSFVLLNETNQMNQRNQTDQTNEIDQIYRPWRGRSMCLNTYSATRRPCAMPSVLSKAQWMPR